jgi:hypothetical protein
VCSAPNDLPTGAGSRVILGAAMSFGIEMKGVDDLKSCMKKCLTLGGGVASSPSLIQTQAQLCVAINFDFATYRCYIFPQIVDGIMNLCRVDPDVLIQMLQGSILPDLIPDCCMPVPTS